MGLDSQHIPHALEALKEDSQQGIFGARGDGNIVVLDSTHDKVDQLLKEYGIPIRLSMTVQEYKKVVELPNALL